MLLQILGRLARAEPFRRGSPPWQWVRGTASAHSELVGEVPPSHLGARLPAAAAADPPETGASTKSKTLGFHILHQRAASLCTVNSREQSISSAPASGVGAMSLSEHGATPAWPRAAWVTNGARPTYLTTSPPPTARPPRAAPAGLVDGFRGPGGSKARTPSCPRPLARFRRHATAHQPMRMRSSAVGHQPLCPAAFRRRRPCLPSEILGPEQAVE